VSALGWIGFLIVATVALPVAAVAATLYPRTRANAVRVHPRPGGLQRLLVLANADCPSASLCAALKRRVGDRAEVFVVAPVLTSPLHFLTEDEEAEREAARARLLDILNAFARAGIRARGVVGCDDPLQAIGDALTHFAATEILLLGRRAQRRGWLERDLERRARDTYGLHVTSLVDVETVSVG
jgi:hypothetical protein